MRRLPRESCPGRLQAVRGYVIGILTPGELGSLAGIVGRVHDRLDPA
jgi:hypothetical protein